MKNPPEGFIEWAKEHGAKVITTENEVIDLLDEIKQKYKDFTLSNSRRATISLARMLSQHKRQREDDR